MRAEERAEGRGQREEVGRGAVGRDAELGRALATKRLSLTLSLSLRLARRLGLSLLVFVLALSRRSLCESRCAEGRRAPSCVAAAPLFGARARVSPSPAQSGTRAWRVSLRTERLRSSGCFFLSVSKDGFAHRRWALRRVSSFAPGESAAGVRIREGAMKFAQIVIGPAGCGKVRQDGGGFVVFARPKV